MSTYSGHPLVGTAGVPLVVYPGLKLNFLRPKFMRVIKDFVRPLAFLSRSRSSLAT
jgi:hypothetical protein